MERVIQFASGRAKKNPGRAPGRYTGSERV